MTGQRVHAEAQPLAPASCTLEQRLTPKQDLYSRLTRPREELRAARRPQDNAEASITFNARQMAWRITFPFQLQNFNVHILHGLVLL